MILSVHLEILNEARLRLHHIERQPELFRGDLANRLKHIVLHDQSFVAFGRKFARHCCSHKISKRSAARWETHGESRVRKADAESAQEHCCECERDSDPCAGHPPCRSSQHEPSKQSHTRYPKERLIDTCGRDQSRHNAILLTQSVPSLSPLALRKDLIEIGSRANRAMRDACGFRSQITDLEEASCSRTTGRHTRKPRNHQRCKFGNGPYRGTLRVRERHIEVVLHFHHKLNAVEAHAAIIDGAEALPLGRISVSADTTSLSDRAGTGDFRYRARAVNDSGASAWSAWAEVRVTR